MTDLSSDHRTSPQPWARRLNAGKTSQRCMSQGLCMSQGRGLLATGTSSPMVSPSSNPGLGVAGSLAGECASEEKAYAETACLRSGLAAGFPRVKRAPTFPRVNHQEAEKTGSRGGALVGNAPQRRKRMLRLLSGKWSCGPAGERRAPTLRYPMGCRSAAAIETMVFILCYLCLFWLKFGSGTVN